MEKKKLTKEQYEKLTPWKEQLRQAYKNSFAHLTSGDFQKIADIWAEITGTPLRKSQLACNTCRLNTLKRLGEMYEKYTVQEEAKKRKTGRPKKLEKIEEEKND